ncbi:hypothetical protein EMPS_07719 [Entomortierella parvispora]|uniref:Galactose oxidase n=1 Tax=Entomortierella parvispora TaxID=205924 RepID=A0A9P3HEZ6_9FUNG|nr:hypothetical protein EMPS_07719 [Entomortierella parvispora]
MRSQSKRTRLASSLLALGVFALTFSSSENVVDAQAVVGVRRTGFTVLNDALYIQGGFDVSTSNQFISLDLSTSWTSDSPAWSVLKDGQSTSHLALASISAASNGGAKGSILAVGGMGNPQLPAFFSSYDVNAAQWTNLTSVKSPYNYLEGHAMVTDPNTGLIYIIGGYGSNTFNQLSVYDPKAKSMVSQNAATAATSLTDVGAVYCSSRNSILTFGGSRAPPAGTNGLGSSDLNEYDIQSKQWKTMSTSGDVPPARLDHCMASSDDGSKIVLFGGTVDGNTYFDTLYVLDVSTGKWKQGQSASVARTRMACAFHSYQFVAWGGSSGASRTTVLNNIPIVYNLNHGKWVNNYNATEKMEKSGSGALIGGVVAALAIAGGLGFFMYKRKKRRQMEMEAFHSDAAAAAAIGGHEYDDANIKVLASPSIEYQHTTDQYGNYVQNQYPLSNIDLNASPATAGYHLQDGTPAAIPGSPMNYYGGMTATPVIQSPSAAYHTGSYPASPYHGSSGASPYFPGAESPAFPGTSSSSSNYGNPGQNPFSSPDEENYYHPPPTIGGSNAPSSLGTNPFMTATTAVAAVAVATTYRSSPPQQQKDPFQEQPHAAAATPPWSQPQNSFPSPGARAPQLITETPSTSAGYVPPPPPA